MSFFEFLDAVGRSMLREMLESIKSEERIAEAHHLQLIHLLKAYLYVGGMSKPVLRYVETADLDQVRETQLDLLAAYVQDFAKHAPSSLVMKIMLLWDSIPVHLGKENKRFVLSALKKSARARDYEEALQWLLDADLVYKVHSITAPRPPLTSYGDHKVFKIYLLDVGLLGAMYRLPARVIVEGDLLFTEFKGSLAENFVAQALKASHGGPLYYWTSVRDAEVDFLLEHNGEIFPIEVKSGTSTKKKSLLVYRDKHKPRLLFRTGLLNLKRDDNFCNYPLYFISRLPLMSPGACALTRCRRASDSFLVSCALRP